MLPHRPAQQTAQQKVCSCIHDTLHGVTKFAPHCPDLLRKSDKVKLKALMLPGKCSSCLVCCEHGLHAHDSFVDMMQQARSQSR